jgi:hypothetical protein
MAMEGSSKTSDATLIATDTFLMFRHPKRHGLPTVGPGDFTLKLNDNEVKNLDDWTISDLPHEKVTLFIPPDGKTVTEIGNELAGTSGTVVTEAAPIEADDGNGKAKRASGRSSKRSSGGSKSKR